MRTATDVLKEMRATATAHEQWAMSLEASSDEAATCTVFASQIRSWVEALESATLDPARFTPLSKGKAMGSALDHSLSCLRCRQGKKKETNDAR